MKLHLLDRSANGNNSFTASINEHNNFLKVWHHHPELELVVIFKSEGTCFIGDGIEPFKSGDIVLIGNGLPHMWLNDDIYVDKNSDLKAKALAFHFKINFLGDNFFETPEMIHLLELFERAKYGIKFFDVSKKLINDIQKILDLKGFEKTMCFLSILNKLSKHTNYKKFASIGFIDSFKNSNSDTQDRVQKFIFKNFNKDLKLSDVATIANMNISAFSRYFKRVNRKTFSKYVSEIRIGYACKLLIENTLPISDVAYESGFNSIANFNRQFKKSMNYTPSQYSKKHKTNIKKDLFLP